MDPNAALAMIRDALQVIEAAPEYPEEGYSRDEQYARDDAAETMAEAFTGLDTWLTRGGFSPDAWQH
jgi:hypothetical protein